MIEYETLIQNRIKRIMEKAKRGNRKSLSRAAFIVHGVMKALFRRTKVRPSPEGMPPHTRKGRLKNAIVYFVDRQRGEALIGPGASLAGGIGAIGGTHERGGVEQTPLHHPRPGVRRTTRRYPARPFAGPGLDRSVPLIGPQWSGSIG